MSRRLCTWCVAVVLPLSASAYVELFVVPDDGTHGIKDGELRWNMNEVNFLPVFVGTANTAGPVGPVDTSGGGVPLSTYFVYAKFVNEVPYCTIYAVSSASAIDSGVEVGRNLLYRHRKTNGLDPPYDRWDNDQPVPLVGGSAVAFTAHGIQFYQPGDGSFDLYDDVAVTALLGAVEVGAAADTAGAFRVGIGPNGLAIRDELHTDPTKTYFPEVRFNGEVVQRQQYSAEGVPAFVSMAPAILFVPEPAACFVLVLVPALARRRT